MIEVKGLVKKYGNHLAVDNLSFTLEKGKVLGFLGPNGAGKSTTMNIITGYISTTEGEVKINGYDIFKQPEEAKKCIGYLPEQPPLYLDMTVIEYLRFVSDIKGIKKEVKQSMIQEVMELTKVSDVSGRLIKHLSKGYRQRVGLAQAIIGYPEVIILDEPTVGLDPKQIIEIRDLIKNLSKAHTVILSSHILSEVSAVCDEIMIINKGKLIVSDTTENLHKSMSSANNISLKVKGSKDKVESILKSINEINKVEVKNDTEEGIVKVTVYCKLDNRIRENIFYALSNGKCPIYEMKSGNMTLEDIFLKLTREDTINMDMDDNGEELYEENSTVDSIEDTIEESNSKEDVDHAGNL